MDQSKYLPKREECLPKGKKERRKGRKGGKSWIYGEAKPTSDGGKHPSKCKWLKLSIFVNLCLL